MGRIPFGLGFSQKERNTCFDTREAICGKVSGTRCSADRFRFKLSDRKGAPLDLSVQPSIVVGKIFR